MFSITNFCFICSIFQQFKILTSLSTIYKENKYSILKEFSIYFYFNIKVNDNYQLIIKKQLRNEVFEIGSKEILINNYLFIEILFEILEEVKKKFFL
jgi:hypothetical protein